MSNEILRRALELVDGPFEGKPRGKGAKKRKGQMESKSFGDRALFKRTIKKQQSLKPTKNKSETMRTRQIVEKLLLLSTPPVDRSLTDNPGLVYYEVRNPSETITRTLNRTQLIRLSRVLKEKLPKYYSRHDKIILLHDNARPHVAVPMKNYLKTLDSEVLPHLTYSPDIVLYDYHLFRSMILERAITGKLVADKILIKTEPTKSILFSDEESVHSEGEDSS
ncbi:Mariner Mos1 transposase [Eumeta japonica]|uniref:Mariner Mos1 transposase n=1 Tax=Eumeta variegata TaxID=151549 RepID=A0A4C1XKS5_EUMVA|nr:Mariner Mos1 transposase [Eumeta japonica]